MQTTNDAKGSVSSIALLRPSNFHAHLRRDALMRAIAKHIMQHMKYLLVMPNSGPIRTMEEALRYFDELMKIASAEGLEQLQLVMTLYYTADITPEVIDEIAISAVVHAIKYYPPVFGATTGSGFGIPLVKDDPRLKAMEERRVPLLGHFESVEDHHGDMLPPEEREGYFMKHVYPYLRDWYPNLPICIEHASTQEAVQRVLEDTGGNTIMTVTPQHMLFNMHDFPNLSWGNHLKCMPILKSPEDQAAITAFATSGDSRVVAGDDTASHLASAKRGLFEDAANGCFWVAHGITAYATVFERASALDQRFEDFMSVNGPEWWGFPVPDASDTITLVREATPAPPPIPVPEENDETIPLGYTTEDDILILQYKIAA